MANEKAPGDGLNTNLDVDYVLVYRFAKTDQAEAEASFVNLIRRLASVGLSTSVRPSENHSLLIFTKIASPAHLNSEVYRSRVQDWLYGVRHSAPSKDIQASIQSDPISEAERLRLVYLLITKPVNEGGAGVTPKKGEWKNVESVFALHDHKFNREWISEWSGKYFLDIDDLTKIRNRFGEKIGFYFAFLQSYFMFLLFPAGFGFLSWLFLGQYSAVYGVVNCLWCVVFVEYWKKQEIDLAVTWGVRGVSQVKQKRPEFKHEIEVEDPITGETQKVYSPMKRLARQALQVPFALLAAALLGSLIAMCFGIEIFISEIYNGPFKTYLVFLPTVILTVVMPTLSAMLTSFAGKLTELENYETTDSYEAAMVSKIFVLNFITSYLPIFLTAFVYVPFAPQIVPYLDVFSLTVKPFCEDEKQMQISSSGFQINPDRLKKQVIYFTVTAQIVNFAMEVIAPFAMRKVFHKVKTYQSQRAAKNGGARIEVEDKKEEKAFLTRVRNEAELPNYDVTTDFREMIVQFGYLSQFSIIWPLTAVSFLINNWIELRGDTLKITLETQRPVPWRADSIGPWLDALGFLTWLGSLSTSALYYLFANAKEDGHGTPSNVGLVGLLLTVLLSEHVYLAVKRGVRHALGKVESPGLKRERAERFVVRKRYLAEALGVDGMGGSVKADGVGGNVGVEGLRAGEKSSREMLEEDARRLSLEKGEVGMEGRFWGRQRGVDEVVAVGGGFIRRVGVEKEGRESKKEL